jgi:hypothetical protein
MPNKRNERWFVEQLRSVLPDFPDGQIESDEAPDILVVRTDRSTLGIEITVFHLPPSDGQRPQQEEQALKDRVVQVALAAHASGGGPALYVTVYFRHGCEITKRDVASCGDAIAQAVGGTPPPLSLDQPTVTVPWARLPPFVSEITIRAAVKGGHALWSASAGGWVAPVQPEQIQAVLDRKAAMTERARAKCDELWLVIVNDEFSRGAPVELAATSECAIFAHSFDRLFWLEPHRLRAWELQSANTPLQPTSGVVPPR